MSSGLRVRDWRPCTLMIVQKLQRNGQPRPASKLVRIPPRPAHHVGREEGDRRALDPRQVIHVVVQRFEPPGMSGPQQVLEPPLGLAREQRDAEIHRVAHLRRDRRQHRQAAAHVEAADAHRDARRAQGAREIHGARELVGLYAHQADQAAARLDRADDPLGLDARVGLVPGGDADLHFVAQNPALDAVEREAVHRGERIGWDRRLRPLDDVAVVVVVRRLDQKQGKDLPGGGRCGTDAVSSARAVLWADWVAGLHRSTGPVAKRMRSTRSLGRVISLVFSCLE